MRNGIAIVLTSTLLVGCSSSTDENSYQEESTSKTLVPAQPNTNQTPAQGDTGTCFDVSIDADCDGINDVFDTDKNGNDINDRFENLETVPGQVTNQNNPWDADNDGLPDNFDNDASNDGFLNLDKNNDGLVDRPGDTDFDGFIDPPVGGPFDADGDGIPNDWDVDVDGDGFSDNW